MCRTGSNQHLVGSQHCGYHRVSCWGNVGTSAYRMHATTTQMRSPEHTSRKPPSTGTLREAGSNAWFQTTPARSDHSGQKKDSPVENLTEATRHRQANEAGTWVENAGLTETSPAAPRVATDIRNVQETTVTAGVPPFSGVHTMHETSQCFAWGKCAGQTQLRWPHVCFAARHQTVSAGVAAARILPSCGEALFDTWKSMVALPGHPVPLPHCNVTGVSEAKIGQRT